MEIGAKALIASKSSDLAIFALSMDKERTLKKTSTKEMKDKVKGDEVTISLPSVMEDDKTILTRDDNEVGATAATLEHNRGDDTLFAKKEGKLRRKQERALRCTRKTAKKNLKRALETESD